jgi:type I restriction enzyme S subunit
MKEDWKECIIGDICSKITSGGTPKSSNTSFYGGSIPWLNTKEVNFNRIYSTEKTISQVGYDNSSAKWIPKNSVIVAMYGATAGRVAISKIELTTNQACCKLIIDSNKADYNFIYYHLCNSYLHLSSLANGGAQQNLNANQIREYPINLPSLPTQQKIAAVLLSLDDKIELNNRINQNLEQQAQAIFKSWFVDKYEKNGIIGDYCTIKSGFAFKSSWWQNEGTKVIRIEDIEQGYLSLETCAHVSNDKIEIAKDFIVQGGDLVIAMTGATIGKFSMIPKTQDPILVNQRVGKFFLGDNPIEKVPFIYCTLKQDEILTEFINRGQGSAQPNISTGDILSIPCWIPEQQEIDNFNQTVQPMFDVIVSNQQENQKLISLRDTLLPKLMSGEIDVESVKI